MAEGIAINGPFVRNLVAVTSGLTLRPWTPRIKREFHWHRSRCACKDRFFLCSRRPLVPLCRSQIAQTGSNTDTGLTLEEQAGATHPFEIVARKHEGQSPTESCGANANPSISSKGLFRNMKMKTSGTQRKSKVGNPKGITSLKSKIVARGRHSGINSGEGVRTGKSDLLDKYDTVDDAFMQGEESLEDWLTLESRQERSSQRVLEDNQWGGRGSGWQLRIMSENGKNMRKSKKAKDTSSTVSVDFHSIRSFTDIGASDRIIHSLATMGVMKPSQIQAMSYRHVFEGHSCILADQTGSGKTLAYLAPLFHLFLVKEQQGSHKSSPNQPRGLVLVPTTELAAQVLGVCRSLSKGGSPLKSMVATGGFKLKTQIDALEDAPDIVIATPGRLLQHLTAGSLMLDNIISVVLDEVDILFDDPEFSEALEKIENMAPISIQYIHVTATLPVDVCNSLLEKHPTSIPLMGPGLHRTATGLEEVLVDCSGDGEKTPEVAYENKKNALLKLVEQQSVSKMIVFCNKIETCRKVENALKRFDRKGNMLSVLPYHAALSTDVRLENMQQFQGVDNDKTKVLVCTDRASRGLDLMDVEHVVLFDFPRDPSEYVRRVGRTARAGGAGKAFVFVVGKQVPLARKIMVRNESGHPIHRVPSHSY